MNTKWQNLNLLQQASSKPRRIYSILKNQDYKNGIII